MALSTMAMAEVGAELERRDESPSASMASSGENGELSVYEEAAGEAGGGSGKTARVRIPHSMDCGVEKRG